MAWGYFEAILSREGWHLWTFVARALHCMTCIFSFLYSIRAPLFGTFWTLFLNPEVVSSTQVLSGLEAMLGGSKQASK